MAINMKQNIRKTTARNYLDLATLLRYEISKIGKKIELKDITEGIIGKIDETSFGIFFNPDRSLVLHTVCGKEKDLTLLISILSNVMCNEKPICSYILRMNEEAKATHATEWDLVDPEKRKDDILSGNAHYEGSTICFFNGNEGVIKGKVKEINPTEFIQEYRSEVEKSKNELERKKPPRKESTIKPIVKKDTVAADKKVKRKKSIEEYNEIELYFAIKNAMKCIAACKKASKSQEGMAKKLEEYRNDLDKLMLQTIRFGVDIKIPEDNSHIKPTELFKAWHSHLDNHYKKILTSQHRMSFRYAFINGNSTERFMPRSRWENSLSEDLRAQLLKK